MPRLLSLASLMLLLPLTVAGAASAKNARFGGAHPLSPGAGEGMCFIEVPHTHSYEPDDVDVLYVSDGGTHVFVGDPTAYDPDRAPRHGYYGHHPVTWARGDHYCYLSGPHHHWHAPRSTVGFTTHGGLFWYVDDHPSWYRKRAKDYAYVDAYYAGMPITRVSLTIGPPAGFFGFYVRGPWVYERVAWYDAAGKGPPPWAPAWGQRGAAPGKWKQHHFVKGGRHKGSPPGFAGSDHGIKAASGKRLDAVRGGPGGHDFKPGRVGRHSDVGFGRRGDGRGDRQPVRIGRGEGGGSKSGVLRAGSGKRGKDSKSSKAGKSGGGGKRGKGR